MICSNTPRLIEQRFLAKICEASSGCWLWVGSHAGKGYGMMRIDGELYGAHHVSWLLYRGPLPEDPDICVLHTCDTPPCVDPDHVEPETTMTTASTFPKPNRFEPFEALDAVMRIITEYGANSIAQEKAENLVYALRAYITGMEK